MSVHFHASGVILNHNFTKEFYMEDKKDCEPCQNLADDVQTGVSNCHVPTDFKRRTILLLYGLHELSQCELEMA